jgi:hypothetical protein
MDPFLKEINSLKEPWKFDLKGKIVSMRGLMFGNALDGAEIPRFLNTLSHKGKYFCHLCDIIGTSLSRSTCFSRWVGSEPMQESGFITREYRDWLLMRYNSNEDTMVFKGHCNFIDFL